MDVLPAGRSGPGASLQQLVLERGAQADLGALDCRGTHPPTAERWSRPCCRWHLGIRADPAGLAVSHIHHDGLPDRRSRANLVRHREFQAQIDQLAPTPPHDFRRIRRLARRRTRDPRSRRRARRGRSLRRDSGRGCRGCGWSGRRRRSLVEGRDAGRARTGDGRRRGLCGRDGCGRDDERRLRGSSSERSWSLLLLRVGGLDVVRARVEARNLDRGHLADRRDFHVGDVQRSRSDRGEPQRLDSRQRRHRIEVPRRPRPRRPVLPAPPRHGWRARRPQTRLPARLPGLRSRRAGPPGLPRLAPQAAAPPAAARRQLPGHHAAPARAWRPRRPWQGPARRPRPLPPRPSAEGRPRCGAAPVRCDSSTRARRAPDGSPSVISRATASMAASRTLVIGSCVVSRLVVVPESRSP